MNDPKPILSPDTLYIGDNGRIFCRDHAGMSALYTGRDLSGQKVQRVDAAFRAAWQRDCPDLPLRCEDCR